MTAFARTHPDVTWTTGNYVTVKADWDDLASKVFRAVNGDRGGAWSPSTPITFNIAFRCISHVLVAFGGSLLASATGVSSTGFEMQGADEWPQYAAGHPFEKRTIVTSMLGAVSETGDMWMSQGVQVCSIAIAIQDANNNLSRPGILQRELRVHDRSTLTRASIHFSVLKDRAKAPIGLPKFRLVRCDRTGNAVALASTAVGADADGWIQPPAASRISGSAWFSGGADQSVVYECDQNNEIDVSLFTYLVEVQEEAGPSTSVPITDIDGVVVRERKLDVHSAATAGTSFNDTDVLDAVGGVRRLLTAGWPSSLSSPSLGAEANGIWVHLVTGGFELGRAPDFSSIDDATPNFIVKADAGALAVPSMKNNLKFFELRSPIPKKLPKLVFDPVLGDRIDDDVLSIASTFSGQQGFLFGPMRPTGNGYTSVVCEFEDIHEMRFQ